MHATTVKHPSSVTPFQWEKPMLPKKSILIVDDDIAHRTMLRILLDWNYEIFEADDGLVAIEQIQNDSFDLVIMDIRMRNVSGLEALDAIKTLRPDIPVVMMTAYWSDQIADEARKKGAFDYLPKPFDFDELRQTIERAVVR
jgi:two-component system response regulator HydG